MFLHYFIVYEPIFIHFEYIIVSWLARSNSSGLLKGILSDNEVIEETQ